MTERTCPSCREVSPADASFCEACGARLDGSEPGATPAAGGAAAGGNAPTLAQESPVSAATVPAKGAESPAAPVASRPPCTQCGGAVADDLYCTQCGAKAPSERDHFREAPASWVAGVCDRGVKHHRNEDAMALAALPEPGSHAAIVVCDGVSSSKDSDVAALAGARAALEVLRAPLPAGIGVPQSADAAAVRAFGAAAAAANTAVIAHTDPASTSPASCTFVAAVVAPTLIRFAHIGDSRAYLFPDAGEARQLTIDHSMAQQLVAGGMSREQAESSPQAHSITRWLGLDSEDYVPEVSSAPVEGPGWLLVCSDGLWNYASEPAALAAQLAATGASEPAGMALALVEWAKAQGGHDNITVALARVGDAAYSATTKESTDG